MSELSIIVPVYNVDKYLYRCIESIISQTFTEFELVLVDDGSTDGSGIICDIFMEKDTRIKAIHKKENFGLSEARNTGIKASEGKYLAFVDGDDFILNDSFLKLIYEAEQYNLDIISGYAIDYFDKHKYRPKIKKHSFENKVYKGINFLAMSIEEKSMSMCAPLNIYKRELIVNNDIYFKSGILHEDELWTPQVFLKASRVKYLDIVFYMHAIREGSITTTQNKHKNALDLINSCYELEKLYAKVGDKMHRAILNDYLIMLFLNAVYVGNLIKEPLVKKKFVIGKARSVRNRLKVALFLINKALYCKINALLKIKGFY